jgi:hypothetical protein
MGPKLLIFPARIFGGLIALGPGWSVRNRLAAQASSPTTLRRGRDRRSRSDSPSGETVPRRPLRRLAFRPRSARRPASAVEPGPAGCPARALRGRLRDAGLASQLPTGSVPGPLALGHPAGCLELGTHLMPGNDAHERPEDPGATWPDSWVVPSDDPSRLAPPLAGP